MDRNGRKNNTAEERSPEYGIGWMPEEARANAPGGKMKLSDKLYRTPLAFVVGISLAAGLLFCLIIFLLSLVFGLRIYRDEAADGRELRYFGFMKGDTPVYGTLYLPDGGRGRVSRGAVRFSDGSRYEGGLEGLLFEGEGAFTDPDGNVYKGSFSGGLLLGEGRIEFSDGGVFSGGFLGGKRDGYGEYVGADGSSYKGYYDADEESGYGTMTYSDGSVYVGYFNNGMRHGKGTYRFASGDLYTGDFQNNVIRGHGSYFFVSGRVFTGEFLNGVPIVE